MTVPDETERAALVALLRTRPDGLRWPEIVAEVAETGSSREVWRRHVADTLPGTSGAGDPLGSAARDLAAWAAAGHQVVTVLDPDYPERLRGIHQAPPVLFARGALIPRDRAVSVVGSRTASRRGVDIAANIARALVSEGITVVSGLAHGVDAAAHRAALDAGGRTVAVIGTGINRVYPEANRALHSEIAERGLLLSQFWPDAPPQRHTFLTRNATMSGYGIATVVVEAQEKSGARVQARVAVEHGRPVVLTDVVVGDNEWARQLVGRPGVHVAVGLDDVLAVVCRLRDEEQAVADALDRLTSAHPVG
ncbi:MAG TPA: DNA-processing protein DprA [Mycobacteriales bacterium]|jgi:DNA processing protein